VLGTTRIPIELGLFVAFFVTRLFRPPRRRPLLLWSGRRYTVFTALTALSGTSGRSPSSSSGRGSFLAARVRGRHHDDRGGYPATGRGRALGALLTFNALGTIAVGVLLGAGVQDGPLEWRTFYLVGSSRSWPSRSSASPPRDPSLRGRGRPAAGGRGDRGRAIPRAVEARIPRNLVLVGHGPHAPLDPAVRQHAWWAFYAERERGFTAAQVAIYIIVAYGFGTVGYYVCGRLMERIGRRPTAVIYFSGGIVFSMILFQVSDKGVSFVALMLAVFFGLGVGPVMSASPPSFSPRTSAARRRRGCATGSRSRATCSALPSWASSATTPPAPSATSRHGDLLMIMQIPGIYLVWRYMPETKGKELEEIADEVGMVPAGAMIV